MFGLQQALAQNVKFCSDCPSGLKMPQICSDWPIRPQASKKPKFVRTGPSGLKKIPNMFGLASKIAGSLSDDSQQCQSILSQPILGGEGHLEHRN